MPLAPGAVRVVHAPYPVCRVQLLELRDELVSPAGVHVSGPPIVHYAHGVDPGIGVPRVRLA